MQECCQCAPLMALIAAARDGRCGVPVTIPTSSNVSTNSRYFWFERVLIGEV